jgi:tetratricopeptide (TPR) repeat protein
MQAIELDPADATLYSNRSLCLLQIGEATEALSDTSTCIKMRPEWIKGYYRKGTALMSLKVRSKGHNADSKPFVSCAMDIVTV